MIFSLAGILIEILLSLFSHQSPVDQDTVLADKSQRWVRDRDEIELLCCAGPKKKGEKEQSCSRSIFLRVKGNIVSHDTSSFFRKMGSGIQPSGEDADATHCIPWLQTLDPAPDSSS